ncbi:MAG: DUF348 domain-containing protein [Chloroflexi bacterium]|mgnify:CR=1 FL=1|nr:DUF348 domain-containing protein [Chloroflexota bacterium]
MKLSRGLVLLLGLLIACQPAPLPAVTVIDGDRVITVRTDRRVPAEILAQANIVVDPLDRILANGTPVAPDETLTSRGALILQLRRHVEVLLSEPRGQIKLITTAFTVGEALAEAGYSPYAGDIVQPPLNSPIQNGMTITVAASNTLFITADGKTMEFRSSARTVGEALAEAGIPLLGLDYSLPPENEAPPPDGQIKVVRVSESVLLAQKSVPFQSELVASAEVPLDQTQILSPGENGLSVQRIRVRYEDGVEVGRMTEEETVVRAPKNRTLAYGTKIEIKTAVVNGVTIEYWRAVQMYATSYSPCRVGTSACSSITASGAQLTKGIVALRTDLYRAMKGQALFIPGYGFATVADACPGCVGKPWIDLGFSDEDYEGWHSWVTVYFLTPVPQNIVYVLE